MIVMSRISCSILERSRVRGRSSRERRSSLGWMLIGTEHHVGGATSRARRRHAHSARRVILDVESVGARCRRDGDGFNRLTASANLITLTVPESLHRGLPSPAAAGERRPVRVAFDLWPTRYARGGSARYAMELSAALRECGDVDLVT